MTNETPYAELSDGYMFDEETQAELEETMTSYYYEMMDRLEELAVEIINTTSEETRKDFAEKIIIYSRVLSRESEALAGLVLSDSAVEDIIANN